MINSSDNTNGFKMCPTCLPDLSHLKELIRISDKKKISKQFPKVASKLVTGHSAYTLWPYEEKNYY